MNEFIVESILPTREVNLLAGPSGAGKTRWLFDTILDWEQGKAVLGRKSYPVPWVYVSADRTRASVYRTLATMKIDPSKIPLVAAWNKRLTLNQIFDQVDKSGAKLAVIESFGSFVDPPANSFQVKSFLQSVSEYCQKDDITVLGVVESPKMKPYERYDSPRQRVSGAAAWGHFSETIILIEPEDMKDMKNNKRVLYLCPRNESNQKYIYNLGHDGRLQLT